MEDPGFRGTRHSGAGISSPLCPTRTKSGVRHPASACGLPLPTGNTGVAGGDARQGRLLSELLEELILVGEPGAGGGRSHGGVWAVCRWQRDGRHANRRGFPGLAPPRCHPGPPSLSLSESSSPARECAQGRGAGRGGQTNPRRPRSLLLLLLSPRPRGRVLQKGVEGAPAGGVTADTEARNSSSAQRPGWRASGERECKAGRLLLRAEAALVARAPHGAARLGTRAATECARLGRAKLAAAAPPRRLLPPLPAPRSPLLAGPTPPSSDSSRVPPGCSPAAV